MNIFKELGKVVKTVAPVLGTAVGGGSGKAIDILLNGLGKKSTKDVLEYIEKDPEAITKLKELETNHAHEIDLKELELDQEIIKGTNDVNVEMVKSEDSFVRRARPLLMYVLSASMIFGFIIFPLYTSFMATIVGYFHPVFDKDGNLVVNVTNCVYNFPDWFETMVMGLYGIYTIGRSHDKRYGK